jgi:hypothetical protein
MLTVTVEEEEEEEEGLISRVQFSNKNFIFGIRFFDERIKLCREVWSPIY